MKPFACCAYIFDWNGINHHTLFNGGVIESQCKEIAESIFLRYIEKIANGKKYVISVSGEYLDENNFKTTTHYELEDFPIEE